MAEVTLNVLYGELKQMHKELHVIRTALIPREELSEAECKEFLSTLREMEQGKEKPWLEAFKI